MDDIGEFFGWMILCFIGLVVLNLWGCNKRPFDSSGYEPSVERKIEMLENNQNW